MKKEELQKQIGQLENQAKELSASDEIVRKNLSQFLGSFESKYYDHTQEVKILRWSEIYFELGKLIERKERLENLQSIRSQLNYLAEQDRIEKDKELKK